jgi:osmotically-inducible protein OsmY
MKNEIKVIILGLALGIGFVGCSRDSENRAGETTATRDTTTTTAAPATPNPTLSSSDLENVVKAKLQSDDQVRAANISVNADADKKEVTLSGTVTTQDQRKRVVDLAKEAHAGLTVNDKIDVKPAS